MIVLGLLMAIMQGLAFYDPFRWTCIEWLYYYSGKKWPVIFKFWPFIMFTDLFHFAHGCFGLVLGYLTGNTWQQMAINALIYSTTFTIVLYVLKQIGKHGKG